VQERHRNHHVTNNRLPGSSPNLFQTVPPFYSASGYDVALGDFTSDGNLDAVVSSEGPSILLGNGDGTFKSPTSIGSISSQPFGVAVGDFNRDGRLDVAFATANGAVVYLGNGDGTFGAGTTFPCGGGGAFGLVLSQDVNNDGFLDLILNTGGGISVLLGNGNGTFQTPIISGGFVEIMAAGDFNNDGFADLAATGPNGLSILLGNGQGSFTAASTYTAQDAQNNIAVGDFNRDGFLDVALPDGQEFLGNGNGTLQAPISFPVVPEGRAVLSADVNGDGILDLVSSNTGQDCGVADYGNLAVSIGNGDGTFQPATLFDSGTCGGNPSFMAVGDLNNDGAPDFILMDGQPIGFVAFINEGKGSGSYAAAESYLSGGSGGVVVADFNRDGNADVASADGSVYLGNGNGSLHFMSKASLGGVEVQSGDFDHDGIPDLAAAVECVPSGCSGGGELVIALGNGDGTFQSPTAFASGGFYPESLTVGDFNGDGNLDIALANNCTDVSCSTGGSVSVFLGNGNGTFNLLSTIATITGFPTSIVSGDFNNDGIVDLVAAGALDFDSDQPVNTLLGIGNGNFQSPTVFYPGDYEGISGVAAGDFNNDGILDLTVAYGNTCSDCDGHGRYLYGIGDGTFTDGQVIETAGGPPASVVAADFSGGGTLTPAFANRCDDPLDCPNGSIMNVSASDFMLLFLGVGDFNNDGYPDLVGSLQFDSGVSIALNIGATSAATTTAISPTAPQTLSDSQPITFTAQVQHTGPGTPTNDVEFLDNGVVIGSMPIGSNGQASFTTSTLAGGPHFVLALYQGDSNFGPSNSLGVHVTVTKATSTTTLTSSVNPSLLGKPVTFTATVSSSAGTPTGTVQFLNGTTVLATVQLNSGTAKFTTHHLPTGSNSITATYSGDSNNTASTSAPLNQIVLEPTSTILTASPNPASYGQEILLTATVTSSMGTPPNGETVTFKQGAHILGIGTLTNGVATLTTPATGIGSVSGTAVYSGDATFQGSVSEVLYEFISPASSSTTLTSSQNPSSYGQPVTFIATVTPQFGGTPTGIVAFSNGTNVVHVALVGGTASYTTSKLPIGTYTMTATYGGNEDFTGSAASLQQTVQ